MKLQKGIITPQKECSLCKIKKLKICRYSVINSRINAVHYKCYHTFFVSNKMSENAEFTFSPCVMSQKSLASCQQSTLLAYSGQVHWDLDMCRNSFFTYLNLTVISIYGRSSLDFKIFVMVVIIFRKARLLAIVRYRYQE